MMRANIGSLLKRWFLDPLTGHGCHQPYGTDGGGSVIALVGSPNVGKSVIFNRLTGAYVTVSNYPGTTVEVARGTARIGNATVDLVDTPGMYSLSPLTEEERVTRSLLREACPRLVLHVVDAKNVKRMLPLTLQLIEAGWPVVLVVNMMDEARRVGLTVNLDRLRERLGVPVVGTSASTGEGIDELRALLAELLDGKKAAACPMGVA